MQGGIKRKSFPSFSRKGVISASNTRPESVLRAQQQLAFPLCLSLCELGEEIELVSGDPGLGAVLGVTVCSCFPRAEVFCGFCGQQSWAWLCTGSPFWECPGSHTRMDGGRGEAGNSPKSHPPFVESSSHPLCDCYSTPHGEGQAQPWEGGWD